MIPYFCRSQGLQSSAQQRDISTETLQSWIKLVTDPKYCNVCGFAAPDDARLRKHEKTHLAKKDPVPKGFLSESYFQKQFPCQSCDVRCTTASSLNKHIRLYHKERFVRIVDDISKHARYKEKKEFACTNCPKSYTSKYKLGDHLKTCSGSASILSNGTDPSFVNEVVSFALETSVINSARTNKVNETTVRGWIEKFEHPESQECTICGKESVNIKALQKHIKKYHTGKNATEKIMPSEETKLRVVKFSKYHTLEETTEKFKVAAAIVEKWAKMFNTELICEFCCKIFHVQAQLDKHKFVTHMSKEEQEAELAAKQHNVSNREDQQVGLKALYEAKYGKLEREDISIGVRQDSRPEISHSDELDEVKEEAESDEISMNEENDEDDGMMTDEGSGSSDADSGDDEELFPDEEDQNEDMNSVKDENFSDVSGLMKQEMVEKDEVPFLNVPAPELKIDKSLTEKLIKGINYMVMPKTGPTTKWFQCDQCPKKYSHRPGLYTHKKHEHDGVKYFCDQCGKQFSRKVHLDGHKESIHDMKRFTCDECGKVFNKQRTLDTHKRAIHEGLMYGCDQCDKKFSEIGNLTTHYKIKHQGMRHQCDKCDSSFTLPATLKNHIRSKHNGERIPCPECDNTFASPRALSLHREAKHLGIRYECDLCNHTSTQKGNLMAHKQRAHPDVFTRAPPEPQDPPHLKGILPLPLNPPWERKADPTSVQTPQPSHIPLSLQQPTQTYE